MELGHQYRIVFDENNVILQFYESRERKKKDGKTEDYVYEENTYHLTLKGALTAYMNKVVKRSETAEEVLKKLCEVEAKIDALHLEQNKQNAG